MVSTVQQFIFDCDTFSTIEGFMFGGSIMDSAAVPSFLYLMMAATDFRQASRTRNRHLRRALRDSGREILIGASVCDSGARLPGQIARTLSHESLKS